MLVVVVAAFRFVQIDFERLMLGRLNVLDPKNFATSSNYLVAGAFGNLHLRKGPNICCVRTGPKKAINNARTWILNKLVAYGVSGCFWAHLTMSK